MSFKSLAVPGSSLTADEQKYVELLSQEDIQGEQEFYLKVLQKLVLGGELEQALRFIDSEHTAAIINNLDVPSADGNQLDFYLHLLIDKMEDKGSIWQYIPRVKSIQQTDWLL